MAIIDQVAKTVPIGRAVAEVLAIWTGRPRTARVATFRASVSRVFRAAVLIVLAEVADLAVIASVGVVDLVAVEMAASVDLVVADLGVGDKNKSLESLILLSKN